MPFLETNSIVAEEIESITRKQTYISILRDYIKGINNDYPYNFMKMYLIKENFKIKEGTEINIYKLYKFVKDN